MQPLQPLRVDWVASPPPGSYPRPPVRQALRYSGPPSYPVPPRWGFPLLAWRRPTSVVGATAPTDSAERVGALARSASNSLLLVAVTAVWAAGSEVWRYVLLLMSRFGALSAMVVGFSDAMVVSSSVVWFVAAAIALVTTVLWLRRARAAAAQSAGYGPSRSDTQVLLGLFVPGMNLVVPGSVAAELEHAALRQPVDSRPRPSGLVLTWWGLWVLSAVMFVASALWSLRSGTQALADGVLLHAASDLVAAAVAVTTFLLVKRITTLLLPVDLVSVRHMRVIQVKGAPRPPLRTSRYAGSAR
jgi:hypothetical protein